MKNKLYSLIALLTLGTTAFAQSQYDSLRIRYDGANGGPACKMLGAGKCYYYSGAGSTSPSFAWEHIVGNWGADDGLGEMYSTGTDKWEIIINIPDYYSDTATCSNPAPQGAIIYKIGVVFRDTGLSTLEGKDSTCSEFFIINVHTDNVSAVEADSSPFPGLTADWIVPGGIQNQLNGIESITLAPNPTNDNVQVSFTAINDVDHMRITVMNAIGQEIATLMDGRCETGRQSITWDGDMNGVQAESGIYFVHFNTGTQSATRRLMVLH